MAAARRATAAAFHRFVFGLLLGAILATSRASEARAGDGQDIRLFRVVTMREDVLLGLTAADLGALGPGADVERLARRIAVEGQLTAWRYTVGRGPDGSTRLVARDRVAVLRQDALLVEPYAAALLVMAPPE